MADQTTLKLVYPRTDYETTADRIFLIGTAPPDGEVVLNGKRIQERSLSGHFAPTVPLKVGKNVFSLRYREESITLTINRLSTLTTPPQSVGFVSGSIEPAVNIVRLLNEPICFKAIALPNAQVSVQVAQQTINLLAQPQAVDLPPNAAVLTQTSNPITASPSTMHYQGCTTFPVPGDLGKPTFYFKQGKTTVSQQGPGQISILSPQPIQVVEVTSEQGTARSGPSTDYSRLTPLPQGTRAQITGRDGEWIRLDYGGWIKQSETKSIVNGSLPRSLIRSVRVKTLADRTDVLFPLQVPVPITVQQNDDEFQLTLFNTTAQTDTIAQTPGPVLSRLDWQQRSPGQVEYRLKLKSKHQWGYRLRYEGTTLVLSLRHPPSLGSKQMPLAGTSILLDPGHGSANDLGSVGPTGYPEKDVTLTVSKLLRQELERKGARVIMTREGDEDLYPADRVKRIEKEVPTLALSLHYNALPDNGDAWRTQGVSTFWYHPQSQNLAVFLHDYLVRTLHRPSYGVYWNNLALTRPAITPAVLLELGFMINPTEFEWIADPQRQQELAKALAEGLCQWIERTR